jgi:hypothetical protein
MEISAGKKRPVKKRLVMTGNTDVGRSRSLSALLSQTLVAFTVEFDNEFELRMRQAGYPGALLSLVLWSNLMRFLASGELSVRELAARALESEDQIKGGLGCLERWGCVELQPGGDDDRPVSMRVHRLKGRILRDGWGSGRGIRSSWLVRLTAKGRKATEIWSPLPNEIERRWEARFGRDQINDLRRALWAIVQQLGLDLPQALPFYWDAHNDYPGSAAPRTEVDPLPVLLAQLLLVFTIDFDRESRVPLRLCANLIRVLGDGPVPLSEIPRLTGTSPESTDIGWQEKPFVVVEPDPGRKRGKTGRLSPLGLRAQQTHRALIPEIEARWQARFGKEQVRNLRGCLMDLYVPRSGERLLLSEGLIPAEGTVRSGTQAPALGRRDVGAAARQRMRDLVAQTELFVRDPINALPHYPLWDMNRGFGP